MTQQEGPLIGRLMRGSVVSNITVNTITCYPDASEASDGVTVTSGASADTFGSWVQFIGGSAASLVTSAFAIIGVTVEQSVSAGWRYMGVLQIGTGA